MRAIYSLILGLALGASSVFVYSIFPPVGVVLAIFASCIGIWAAGRQWGRRSYKLIAALAWGFVVLRAGFPGINEEYLIQGNAVGTSFINFGFIAVVVAVLAPL